MVMVFLHFELIWVNLDSRSGQGQVKNQILKVLILKKCMFWCRLSLGMQWYHLFFGTWARTFKIRVWLYDVTLSRNFIEVNLYFGSKIDASILNFVLWWLLASCWTYKTNLWKFPNFWIWWSFFFIQKQIRWFWNYGVSNQKILQIRDTIL